MSFKKEVAKTLEIDLHDMSVEDGKRTLERFVMSAPSNVKEITVIHGFHRGKGMLNMVRKQFKCRRVERQILTTNNGITILVLKQGVAK